MEMIIHKQKTIHILKGHHSDKRIHLKHNNCTQQKGRMECGYGDKREYICAVTHRDIKETNTDHVSWIVWLPQPTVPCIEPMKKHKNKQILGSAITWCLGKTPNQKVGESGSTCSCIYFLLYNLLKLFNTSGPQRSSL